jgi:putative membrane-bound dehydrogenase-like protein
MNHSLAFRVILLLSVAILTPILAAGAEERRADDVPRTDDASLTVELFAAAPDIVHPIGIDFDRRGRLLVIESHTHFPPEKYKGPRHDRIRILEDSNGDGKADRFTTFFEGTVATMDIAVHPDNSVYVATRNEVLRLRDTDGDGKADERRRIAFLDTAGNYPHNGLSGLAFDSKGDLYFGMGENLGAGYKLTGADGTTISDEGEGGNIFWCTAEGQRLRRVATGFWNPFGVCRDIFGRIFAVDNDPDAMPPCRMLHVVEGGDYGYQFRYGRSGRHPFQAWNGQLPGTLPMVSGTGEAPCEVLSYESDGLPRDYRGNLLVTSWADHRVERYVLREQGASWTAERKPFVQGGKDFRPVGLAVAPDGSLFVSDWVLSDYTLHHRGAIWHVRSRRPGKNERPADPRQALCSAHRPLREAAARRLAADAAGRDILRQQIATADERPAAAALTALIDASERKLDLAAVVEKHGSTPLRAQALRALVAEKGDGRRFLAQSYPAAVRFEAVASLRDRSDLPQLRELLTDADPFLRHAAIQQLARSPELLAAIAVRSLASPAQRQGVLLAQRASGKPEAARSLATFLADPDDEVRFLAAKWVADRKLIAYRNTVVELLNNPRLGVPLHLAYATALARIDNQEVSDVKLADSFLHRLASAQTPAAARVPLLRLVPGSHPGLTLDLFQRLLAEKDPEVQQETIKLLNEYSHPKKYLLLLRTLRDSRLGDAVRAEALLGLAEQPDELSEELVRLAEGDRAVLRDAALRTLVGVKLSSKEAAKLEAVARGRPEVGPLVARVLGRPFASGRPAANEAAAWLKRLDGPADAAAGRQVFFHPKLGGCYRCHRVEGRGQDLGPDLSTIGRRERAHLLESLLQPSTLIAPHYQSWSIETSDGKVHTGMLLRTYLDEYTYLDTKGKQFKLITRDIVDSRPVASSIMPEGLADLLTDQELRDLLAYLVSCR